MPLPTIMVPTPDQVHALIPVRPQFTQSSRPSVDEVQAIIYLVADSVASESATTYPTSLAGKVRLAVAYNVAAQVEASYFPEQQLGPDGPSASLYSQYVGELTGLRAILGSLGLNTSGRRAFSVKLNAYPLI